MSGNKAMRRALETSDAIRVSANIPLIIDKTELITPAVAQEMLKRNERNRPINWKAVEKYAEIMRAGKWELHAQGIVLDEHGNILTGQKRLWAVVKSGVNVYFRVSRGNPASSATLLDRGTPQTARDLAARNTERKHSPTESSIARAIALLRGKNRPSVDDLADLMTEHADIVERLLTETHGTKKTRAVLMMLAVIAENPDLHGDVSHLVQRLKELTDRLETALAPASADACWGKGTAFTLAITHAKRILMEL